MEQMYTREDFPEGVTSPCMDAVLEHEPCVLRERERLGLFPSSEVDKLSTRDAELLLGEISWQVGGTAGSVSSDASLGA